MISIVTGTLNRKFFLPFLIKNTVESNPNLELVLVDGGSTDGTIEYIENLNNNKIKLIKVGQRSSYPHFMNLGIKNSTYEFICQWNDDVLLINDWNEIFKEIKENDVDAWLFSWQYVPHEKVYDINYCNSIPWNLCNLKHKNQHEEIVMNYGIYKKDLFKKNGLYDPNFHFYYADGELSHRFFSKGAKFKDCHHVKVASIEGIKKTSTPASNLHLNYYNECRANHLKQKFQSHLEFLK